MIIKKIKKLKSKVVIIFENSSKLEIANSVYPNFYLYEGKDVSKKELNEIKSFDHVAVLLQYALKIRSKALYSEYKMREKLYNKGANKREVDQLIKNLKKYDLIDDKAFAEDLLEYYNSLNYGENKIRTKLLEKGIFQADIDKLKFPVSNERKKANNIFPKLEKKYEKYNSSQKKLHIYNAYLQLGFSREIALEMKDKVKDSNQKDELSKLKADYQKAKTRLSRKYQKKELKQKIITALLNKGYRLNDILKVIE